MVWLPQHAWDHSTYLNRNGDPLFLMPVHAALGYSEISMPQGLPNEPDNIDDGINHRHQVETTTKLIGPTSGRELISTPFTIANMYNIASIRLARAFESRTQQYNQEFNASEAAPLVSLPKQLTDFQMNALYEFIESQNSTGNIVITVGSDAESIKRMDAIEKQLGQKKWQEALRILHFDNPNLNTPKAFSDLKYWRERYPDTYLIAGNTDNPATARHIAKCGADSVKIGIGPGAMCTTRLNTGIGVPQATAVAAAVMAVKDDNGESMAHIMADGGIRRPKDWVYALGLGADHVMFGSIFGGYKEGFETDDDLDHVKMIIDGQTYVPIYGSASREALLRYHAGKNDWYRTPEGRKAAALLKTTSATDLLDQYRGGLRSALTHRGCGSVDEFQATAQFLPIAGSHVDHSIHTLAI